MDGVCPGVGLVPNRTPVDVIRDGSIYSWSAEKLRIPRLKPKVSTLSSALRGVCVVLRVAVGEVSAVADGLT